MSDALETFVRLHTKDFDDSHNIEHALAVYKNAKTIAIEVYPNYDPDIIRFSAMLHDVCDHKYKDKHSISKQERDEFIKSHLGQEKGQIVIDIIENMSYSKEVKGLRKSVHQPYLNILSDADKLEAIGTIGINRCIDYTKAHGGRVPEDVIEHCHEKLLRLYNDCFIRTEKGRQMALPLHKEIEDYVLSNTKM